MLDHSIAKVELFRSYLSIYLNILQRAKFIDRIYLYDLFAGEGIYEDGEIGSSIMAGRTIKEHFQANQEPYIKIEYVVNEPEKSLIEKGVKKIDRIRREMAKIKFPENVSISYESDPYDKIISKVISNIKNQSDNERSLIFVDPWGYKEVDFDDLRIITQSEKTEVILFLPICFMYRFADRTLSSEPFPGGESLESLLKQIFTDDKPDTENQHAFIKSIKAGFQSKGFSKYVDTFVIERSKGQYFCLFFFTNNQTGMRKMLEAKWSQDEEQGYGFRFDRAQGSLFSGVSSSDYTSKLQNHLRESNKLTNHEVYEFGLLNGHLPKHSNQVINEMKNRGICKIRSLDGGPERGNYIDNTKRRVEFIYKGKQV